MSDFLSSYSFMWTLMGLNILLSLSTYIALRVGIISIACGGFLGIGAYAGTLLVRDAGMSLLVATVVCAALGALVAQVLGMLLLNLNGVYFAIGTGAFVQIVYVLALALPITGGALGISGIPLLTTPAFLMGTVILVLVGFAIYERAPRGRAMRAVALDGIAAEVSGFDQRRVRRNAFVVSGVLACGVGPIWAHTQSFISPGDFDFAFAMQMLLIAAIGGAGAYWGTVVAAVVLTALPVVVGAFAEYEVILRGVVLLVIVIFLPGGIVSIPRLLRRRFTHAGSGSAATAGGQAAPQVTIERVADRPKAPRMASDALGDPCIAIRGLNKVFGGVTALDNVDLDVYPGEILAIIGPNGAGKTTLLNAINGLTKPDSGSIASRDTELVGKVGHQASLIGIGRTFQAPRLFPELRIREHVVLPAAARKRFVSSEGWVTERLAEVGLHGNPDAYATGLSYRDQRLLDIARALAPEPFCLLLDEPSAGMTAQETAELADLLRATAARGVALVMVEHNLQLIGKLANRAVVLDAGRIIASGSVEDVRNDPAVAAAYLGVDK